MFLVNTKKLSNEIAYEILPYCSIDLILSVSFGI